MNATIYLLMMFAAIMAVAIFVKSPWGRKFYGYDKDGNKIEKNESGDRYAYNIRANYAGRSLGTYIKCTKILWC